MQLFRHFLDYLDMEIQACYISSNRQSIDTITAARAVYLQARKEAARLLHKARLRVKAHAAKCCNDAQHEGFSIGYRHGLEKAQAENLSSQARFSQALIEARDECLNVALAIAHELIKDEISSNPAVLLSKIDNLLQHIPSRILRIVTAPCQLEPIKQEILRSFSTYPIQFEASEDLNPGDARVHTISGIIEMSWESHFELLKKTLLDNNPAS